jgi:hypothetical protein
MNNLRSLDQLIADVGSSDAGSQSAGPCGLLIEHLRAARSSLLGSMPGEYRSSLQEAKASLACISNKNAQTEVRKRLQNLLGAR